MFEFKTIRDEDGKIKWIETSLLGNDLLNTAKLNKGCAFPLSEREQFHLMGLLPSYVETLDQQVARTYLQFREQRTNLGRNIYLNVLHDYNETLFYKLVSQHLEEMLPIIYTPTVGEAVQHFSLELRKPKGLYIDYNNRHRIEEILENRLPPEIDLAVVTDGEAVLGIGDQGIGGMNISTAKLMVYALCGGINPHRFLPVQLDVGTDNPHLLNDPMYLGWRHERIRGEAYDEFIDLFIKALLKKFPHVFLHWEDFGRDNAGRILNRYRNQACTFNGDIQGTGVVALASILAAANASGIPLREHRVVIFGAGAAGTGIASQVQDAFHRAGLDNEQAKSRLWLVDKFGLLTTACELKPTQVPFAHAMNETDNWSIRNKEFISLYDVIKNIKPTILIGCSTVAGAFSNDLINLMTEYTERPVIMPLSNPTPLSEATPEDLMHWTKGKAIIATGSPFPDILYEGKRIRIAQSNNALAFPGIGLGSIAAKAKHVSDKMLWAATEALSAYSPTMQDKMAPLLPKLSEAKGVSIQVALAVAEQAREEGLSQLPDSADLKKVIQQCLWEPAYHPYKKTKK